MRVLALSVALPALAIGCRGTIDISDPDALSRACEEGEPEPMQFEISFPASAPGSCPWGEDDNLEMAQGLVTARVEQVQVLEVPDDVVVCDLGFDFEPDPGVEQIIRYDDNFFLAFSGVVLAASYGPMVDAFEREDDLPIWDWAALAGTTFGFDAVPPYCLGEEEGASECTVPMPETPGPIALDFGGDLVSRLSFHAIQQGAYDFRFVAIGDNDPDRDCQHDAFSFVVDAPVIAVR